MYQTIDWQAGREALTVREGPSLCQAEDFTTR